MDELVQWAKSFNPLTKLFLFTALLGGLSLFGLLFFRMLFVTYVENYQLGYSFDNRTGEIHIYDHAGYFINPPFLISVHTIDERPLQTCITAGDTVNADGQMISSSVNQRVLNCKLVKFDQAGLELFLSWHGRGDYGPRELREILKIYAYDETGQQFPFLQILQEAKGTSPTAFPAPAPQPSTP